ncbi:hypothetical protein N7466_002252 [Penicillium verhagenii]|uniref:uncharacterized protein n=1 Tax=Penicillium verhagenii TaxID=1562060 RepID=UPI002545245D|nr:uncharacterized protein N7466_002252 [Penicillium verhagenii]KAJ5939118.1 hypothetical protein N7466_002252 [Penicillium verhagenii]
MEKPTATVVIAPGKAVLAFAIAIVKQKPPDKDVKDYILEIRQCIRNDMQVQPSDKFFDSVAFWQKAYKESEAEQAKLLNRIFELEQRTQGLRSKIKNSQSTGILSPGKRKASPEDSRKELDPPRKKTQPHQSKTRLAKKSEGYENEEYSDNENAPKLMRQIYTIQRALQKRNNTKQLATNAVNLCKITESEILEAMLGLKSPENQPKPPSSKQVGKHDLAAVTKAAELSFNLVHQALKKVMGTQEEKYCKGQITYYLVCLFESTMSVLTQICTGFARTTASTSLTKGILQETSKGNRMKLRKQEDNQKKKLPVTSKAKPLKMEKSNAQHLLDLLCTMALSLDLNRSEDQEVMEGFLFIVIDRVGKMLSLFVFDNGQLPSDRCPDLEAQHGIRAMKEEGLTREMAQFEAKNLIQFLERVLGPQILGTEVINSQFLGKIKGRLQKSLMQAVFGNTDPLFREGLARPTTPPVLSGSIRPSKKQEFPEWFTEELWRLVGWDLLYPGKTSTG